MTHLPFLQILLSVLSAGSVNANDWMTMVQPTEYFKSRNIEVTLDRMIDFAIADIKTPKAQIRQLAALQHLTNESDKFKRAANYASNREAIEEIAAGKRGVDPAGFGQEYARRLLAKLDGKAFTAPKQRPLRHESLDWFPADAKLALAFDMRSLQDISNGARKEILTTMSEFSRLSLYDQLETMGNVRVDRTSFALSDAANPNDQNVYVRITGRGNQEWVADALKNQANLGFEIKRSKDADGTPIMTLYSPQAGAVFVLVGNTEMLIASHLGFDAKKKNMAEDLLAVRSKKNKSAAEGLKDQLAKLPDKTIAFLAGDLPAGMQNDLKQLIEPLPAKFLAHAERTEMGVDLKMSATFKDAAEAGKFVAKVTELRKQGMAELQKALKMPPQTDGPPLPFQALIALLDTVQVERQGDVTTLRAFLSNAMVREFGDAYADYNHPRASRVPAPKK